MRPQTKSKIAGYLFRLTAVIIFGLSPIAVKYFLESFNGFTITSIVLFFGMLTLTPLFLYKKLFKRQKYDKSCYSFYFWVAIISDGILAVCYYTGLHFTSATNAILILSFAPFVGLIFGAVFWTQKPAYLLNRKDTIIMLIIFTIGTIGIFFLVLDNSQYEIKLLGDGIVLVAMLLDVISTLALISYIKQSSKFEGLDFVIHKLIFLGLLFSPMAIYYLSQISLSQTEIYALLFQAILPNTLAYYCAYESYKRLDGFVNFLLFNLSIVVTLMLEMFFFSLQLSFMLVVGAALVIGSSILAEYINTTAETKLKS